ncbi:MAG: 30S ribosomal protein S17 [Planctomycetaceae bacterium]|nr:30S ribosomal protein S17 [Planctomycetaceae bacterium]
MEANRNSRRLLQGIVSSNKMAKTITVRVERTYAHPKYGKFVRRHKQYAAHDELGTAKVGDVVEICATRPISKTKRWRLVNVLAKANLAEASALETSGVEIGAGASGKEEGVQ